MASRKRLVKKEKYPTRAALENLRDTIRHNILGDPTHSPTTKGCVADAALLLFPEDVLAWRRERWGTEAGRTERLLQ